MVAKLLLLEYKLGMEASSNIPVEGVESGEERAEGREGQARREEVMAGAVDPPAGIDMMTWQKLAEGLWFGEEESYVGGGGGGVILYHADMRLSDERVLSTRRAGLKRECLADESLMSIT